ncbi:MAG: GNAT family N-acetyltransferase [Myxococcota bacterium]
MPNKRGISQAFHRSPDGLQLRPASVFDVFDISRVLIDSITVLCEEDHRNDPAEIADWTANKSPGEVRRWITSGFVPWLGLRHGQLAGVGGVTPEGAISLLYVAPQHSGIGVGTELLAHLEDVLRQGGHGNATLVSTKTALAFYRARGWEEDGAPVRWRGSAAWPMRKTL